MVVLTRAKVFEMYRSLTDISTLLKGCVTERLRELTIKQVYVSGGIPCLCYVYAIKRDRAMAWCHRLWTYMYSVQIYIWHFRGLLFYWLESRPPIDPQAEQGIQSISDTLQRLRIDSSNQQEVQEHRLRLWQIQQRLAGEGKPLLCSGC